MKLLNEEQKLGLIHGIEQGFAENGMELNEWEKIIVTHTVGTTVDTLTTLLDKYAVVIKK